MVRSAKIIKIAVDGYSSCGKSTLARELAQNLGYIYIDSGAMYRAVTLFALQNNYIGQDFFNKNELITNLNKITIHFEPDKNFNPITFLNNKNVENEIRQIAVSSYVSEVSAVAEVRERMVSLQRKLSENSGVVMDGRDIGTVVFPEAELKLFITADIDIRTQRRFDELILQNKDINFETVKQNLMQRDNYDKSRKTSPLRQAKDAILIDNSNLTKTEQLEIALKLAKKAINEN
ncbi:MAG: (d)CMP kinase [Bacteroidales bacterium]|nr:(d)CMP kinase [Bacteroidales bacterium]MDY0141841.1 (d)CMP kinase [Bacteroidales bacterium]